jgi:hypothetical protein
MNKKKTINKSQLRYSIKDKSAEDYSVGLNRNDTYKKIFDVFDKGLDMDSGIIADYSSVSTKEIELKVKLNNANVIINDLKIKLNNALPEKIEDPLAKKILTTDTLDVEPLVLRPAAKTEGIFNDANLTEDYELGMRFYQLGLKTGFFNVKLDGDKNSTRVATAEFFPNKFWPAVKQRSRWIAGICLQNWKAHKWDGNLTTKYFLFRDRKPLLSFWSTFLSNILLIYFIYLAVGSVFNFDNSLISGKISPVLAYLMTFNLVFMVSKAVHRFIFTSGWYGPAYGFASIFRLAIDSFINFFAIIRSVSVYRKTKHKVVWDATTHY